MKRWFILGTVLMLGALWFGWRGQAQGWREWGRGFGGPGEHRMGRRLLALLGSDRAKTALGLTDEQAGQLRETLVKAQKSAIRIRADMAVTGIELRELLLADKPDHDTVMKKVEEISKLRGEMMKEHAEALLAAKSVLTPEQQKKIRSFIREHRGEFRRERFFQRPPGRSERPGAPPAPNEP